MKVSRIKALLVLALGLLAFSGTARAQTSFATFGGPGSVFRFVNKGSDSTFGTYDKNGNLTTIPVNFAYNTGLGGLANGYDFLRGTPDGTPISASLTMSAVVDTTAIKDSGEIYQSLRVVQLSFVANTPLNGRSNLLTVTPNTIGTLHGSGSAGTQEQGDTSIDFATDGTVGFTSDFLDFSGLFNNKNYGLSLSGIFPGLSIATNGYLRNFETGVSGSFGSDPLPGSNVPPPVPEPGAVVTMMSLGGMLGIGLVRGRIRAAKRSTQPVA